MKQGFSISGLLGCGFWLLWHRILLHGSLALVIGIGVYALFPNPAGYIYGIPYGHRFGIADVINIGICFAVGFLGHDWRTASLLDRGFENLGSEASRNPDGAKATYLHWEAPADVNLP